MAATKGEYSPLLARTEATKNICSELSKLDPESQLRVFDAVASLMALPFERLIDGND